MGQRLRWSQRSWRARVGWLLLGWALVVMCVTLPAWALTAGDLNVVAGWANILAFPVTGLGLLLVLVDRGRHRRPADTVDGRQRPQMIPPLDRMIERPELGDQLVAALTSVGVADAGVTTGLEGAGGFGKTRLATWVCHHPEIARRYPAGLLWVTVGQDAHGADLADRINDLAVVLGGQRPAVSDPDAAGAELGRLLDEHGPMLMIVDDVWDESQLRPFRFGGQNCTRLVTTRITELLPAGGPRVRVDAMSAVQSRQLVADGVEGLPTEIAEQLANVAGRWPVLLNLVNGVLRRRVARGQPSGQAAAEILHRLSADGPTAFDPVRPGDRGRAVRATVEASLDLLEQGDRERYLDLAIFPEDIDIPLDVLTLLWPDNRVDVLADELVGLGLVADYRLNPPGPRLVLHDVMRAYLQNQRTATDRAGAHRRLIDAATRLLPADATLTPTAWWLLPADAVYLWRYLPFHLHQAGHADELAALVCDLRWVQAKTARFGSVVAVEADLELAPTPTGSALRAALRQSAHLLGPIEPPEALGATLASRLYGVPGLESVQDRYHATLPGPRLDPARPLPDRPDPSQPVVTTGHTGEVDGCAFSPDGTILATTSDDTTVRLWRMPDGVELAVLTGHSDAVNSCAFSADGALLATASDDHTVRLWRVRDHTEQAVLLSHIGPVFSCAFSPDGILLATTGDDQTVRLWRVGDGREPRVLLGHTGPVYSCAFSPNGALLATTSEDRTVRLWQVRDGRPLSVLRAHADQVNGCAFSPDGNLLATTSNDATTRLWRLSDGSHRVILSGLSAPFHDCAFSPDGTLLATTNFDHTVRLLRISDGTEQAALRGHTNWVNDCAFSPDGTLLATAGGDSTVRLWRIPAGRPHRVLSGHAAPLAYCAFSPDGTLLATANTDATVQLFRMPEGSRQAVLSGHTSRVISCVFSPDGAMLATTSFDQTIRLWQMPDGIELAVLSGHTGGVVGCAFSPDGTVLASTAKDRTVRLWRLLDRSQLAVLTGHTGRVERCAFSPDGGLLASTSQDKTVRLWQMPHGDQHAVLSSHTGSVDGCAFSPDGTLLATASFDHTARLWQIPGGSQHAVLTGHTSWLSGCAFSPDGTLLATVSRDRTVRLWDIATGRCHCALRVAGPLMAIAWHPGGTMLCAVGSAGVYLLNHQA